MFLSKATYSKYICHKKVDTVKKKKKKRKEKKKWKQTLSLSVHPWN